MGTLQGWCFCLQPTVSVLLLAIAFMLQTPVHRGYLAQISLAFSQGSGVMLTSSLTYKIKVMPAAL